LPLPAGDIESVTERPIPILKMSEFLLPINLGLASTDSCPRRCDLWWTAINAFGTVVTGISTCALNYVAGEPAGLILAAGLVDRWIATFEDQEVAAATTYEQRKQLVKDYTFCWCSG